LPRSASEISPNSRVRIRGGMARRMSAPGETFGPTCRTDQGPSRMHLVKYIDNYPSLTCFGVVGMADLGCNHNTKLSGSCSCTGTARAQFRVPKIESVSCRSARTTKFRRSLCDNDCLSALCRNMSEWISWRAFICLVIRKSLPRVEVGVDNVKNAG
jgi:hypothetical protein